MKIHNDHSEGYLSQLITSLEHDILSFIDWHCIHLSAVAFPDGHGIEVLVENLSAKNITVDCELVIGTKHDIFIFGREQSLHVYESLCHEIGFNSGNVDIYNLFHDSKRLLHILKTAATAPIPSAHHETHDFGEVRALQEVLGTARKLRQTRSPQFVLLVEDDPVTRRVASGILKDDYAVITAQDAKEAVSNYFIYAPDIVFLDIGLPDHTGFDVLHQICVCDPDAYIVMFSGNSYLANVMTALNAGASGFVSKPFRREQLNFYLNQSVMHHNKTQA